MTETTPTVLVERCGWSLVWFTIFVAGLQFWSAWSSWPGAAVVAPLLVIAGIAGIAAVWMVSRPSSLVMQGAALASSLVAAGLPQAVAIHVRRYYSTDAAAFNQVAVRLLLHGRNPYTGSMITASHLLKPPSDFWTYTVTGSHISHVSYPAGSFLFVAPFVAAGLHHAIVDWVDLGAWLVTGVLLFVMVPAVARWLALLVLLTSLFVGTFSSGGTDALFLPFLAVAVWRWDRFALGRPGARRSGAGRSVAGRVAGLAGWIGPVALGLACTVKQTPWFCVPFLAAGIALESHRDGRDRWWMAPACYLGIVVGVFAAVDLPFVIWNTRAWWKGVLLPLTQPLVADGQGLVTLALHGLTGGVALPLLTVAGALVYLALLVAMVLWYPQVKRIWLFLLPAVLFVPARSLSNYLVDFFPVAIVAALSTAGLWDRDRAAVTRGTGVDARPASPGIAAKMAARAWKPLTVTLPLAAAVALSALAFTSAPLGVSVTGFTTSNATRQLDSVTVTFRNRTRSPVTPHVMVLISGDHPSGYWSAVPGTGHRQLAGGASETVTLVPGTYTPSPVHGAHWLVEAYTASPDALSTSSLRRWTLGKPQ